ncbi:hypothetical protein C8N46_101719 [Kordia periserrulae]|uniref:Uncharacterized protein n=1 Tax=Kordia periserrulae TaxID=701523 RepID=A0A2T6C705_9FLAO|nr:hypothetical protein [Kordia periserrulae]PTX64109.1 hypothetical protein C8N46_101719 [Kordia periserrulae]
MKNSKEIPKFKSAFPRTLLVEIEGIISNINITTKHVASRDFTIFLKGEKIEIPYRIYWEVSTLSEDTLNDIQKLILACILTRHHNGFIREENLNKLFSSDAYWTIPFIIQLTGEYVVEILEFIFENFDLLDKQNVLRFILENKSYWQKTKQRIASYWNCYYRYGKNSKKGNYVGFRLIEKIESLEVENIEF